jgi:hypothetical protein
MENGFLIESKSLTPQQAQLLVNVISQATIKVDMCAEAMAAIISLRRIATGVDLIQTVKTESSE